MVVFGALLVYDGLLLAWRTGFGHANIAIMTAGILDIVLFAAIAALAPATSSAFGAFGVLWASFAGAAFILGFICYVIATALLLRRAPGSDYRYVIVLGAGLVNGLRPSRLLAGRLDLGNAWFDKPAADEEIARVRKIIVCGGQGSDEKVAEAKAMHDYLIGRGVSENAIICENASRTTMENLRFAKRIIDERSARFAAENAASSGRCVVVTSNFHALRADIMAKRSGLNSAGTVGKATRLYYLPGAAARDYTGVLRLYPAGVLVVLAFCAVAAVFCVSAIV